MSDMSWGQLFVAALGGGLTVKVLDIAYQEFRHRKARSLTAEEFVDQHLGPLLKTADELVGKLRSLAEVDFKPVHRVEPDEKCLSNHEFASLLYLFGRFWARVELVRHKGLSVSMGKEKRGAELQHFLDCLESRRIRIVDRILQRAVGEVIVRNDDTIPFVEFARTFETDETARQWIVPLAKFLSRTEHTTERQQLLQYGTVLHALIDTLDSKHLITRERPAFPNKLSQRSWADLNYRVFGVYLKFVANKQKYIGPPKKAARKKGRQAVRTLEP
jgi:hypothetical protein